MLSIYKKLVSRAVVLVILIVLVLAFHFQVPKGRKITNPGIISSNLAANFAFADTTAVSMTINNMAPSVSGVSLNAGSNITLVENTIKSVDVTGQMSDDNNCADITDVTAMVYLTALDTSCSADDNSCYHVSVCNTSDCNTSFGSTQTIADVTCTSSLWFHANPDTWEAAILVTDTSNTSAEATSSAVTIFTLNGLDVTASIAYGSVNPGNDTEAVNQTTVVTVTGNAAIECSLKGIDATSPSAGGTVVVSNQHHDLSAFTYGGTESTLTTSDVAVELVTSKPSTNPSNSSDIIYWGLGIDAGTPVADDWSGYNTFMATVSICPGDSISYEGTTYDLVEIGDQCWFADNLNVGTKLATGASEPNTTDEIIEKWCYNSHEVTCTSDGGLYSWGEAISVGAGSQGICPDGWHVPSDSEFCQLEVQLCEDLSHESCSSTFDCIQTGYLGTNEGSYMANDLTGLSWEAGALREDSQFGNSGLNVGPAGSRGSVGNFTGRGASAYLWSSTEDDPTDAWHRYLSAYSTSVNRNNDEKIFGLSVRCVRD